MLKRIFIILISLIFTTACEKGNNTKTEEMTILSYKTPCSGLRQRLCYLVKSNNADETTLFYNSIENFEFSWGHTYQISVLVTEIKNPPADASSVKYQLKQLVSDVEDDIGQTYKYELVELLDQTLTQDLDNQHLDNQNLNNQDSKIYYFLFQPFECSAEIDCDGLVNMNNTGGLVNVTFEYLGEGKVILTDWN